MDVFEAIKGRRSIREFQQKQIPEEIIAKLIDALIWAPSAGNLQSRKFYFIFNEEVKKKLVEASFEQDFISQAPLVIVGCADERIEKRYYKRGKELYSICDVACAAENLMLEAYELGLGTVFVGSFKEEEVSQILKIPKSLRPIVIIPVGYPAEQPEAPPRVSTEEAVEVIA